MQVGKYNFKNNIMNKLIKASLTLIIIATFASCEYEDFESDYIYSTVYFANQKLKRTFVEGEINTIKIGIVLGGKRENTTNEQVIFTTTDTTGFSSTGYTLMPDNYYTLSNYSEIVISSGQFSGDISMTIDPAFFADSLATSETYAIPFKLVSSTTDSILEGKDSLLLILDFEHTLFGNYYHNGQVVRLDALTSEVMDTIIYHQEEPVTNPANNWSLTTVASSTLKTRGLGWYTPSDLSGFFMVVNDDYSIGIVEDPGVVAIGLNWRIEAVAGAENRYNAETKEFYLNYKFIDTKSGYECIATDTLIFRNRILDGVNQWNF